MVPNPPSPHPHPPLWCPGSLNFSQVVSLHPNTSECYPPFLLFPLESSFLGKPFSIPASPLASNPCPSATWLFPEATSLTALAPHTNAAQRQYWNLPNVSCHLTPLHLFSRMSSTNFLGMVLINSDASPDSDLGFLYTTYSLHIHSHGFNFPEELVTPKSVPPTQMSLQHSRPILPTTPGHDYLNTVQSPPWHILFLSHLRSMLTLNTSGSTT